MYYLPSGWTNDGVVSPSLHPAWSAVVSMKDVTLYIAIQSPPSDEEHVDSVVAALLAKWGAWQSKFIVDHF